LKDNMEERELNDVVSKVESQLVCIYQLLNSHEEPVGGGESHMKVQLLENVKLPFDNVLLRELWISRGSSDYVFERWRVDLLVLHSDEETTKRHLVKVCLLASHFLNAEINELASNEKSFRKHLKLLEEIRQPLEKLSSVLLFNLCLV